MKINRIALRKAVDEAITEHKAAHQRKAEAYEASQVDLRKEWVEKYSAAWQDAAKAILKKVRAGQPVTSGDLVIRAQSWNTPEVYDRQTRSSGVRPPGDYQEPYELHTLAQTLDLIVDDEVSSYALEQMGITRSALREAIALVGRAKAGRA